MKAKKLALLLLIVGIIATIGTSAVVTWVPAVDESLIDTTPNNLSTDGRPSVSITSVSESSNDSSLIDFQIINELPGNMLPGNTFQPFQPVKPPQNTLIFKNPLPNPVSQEVPPIKIPKINPPPKTPQEDPVEKLETVVPPEPTIANAIANDVTWPKLPSGFITIQVADGITNYFITTLSGVPEGYDVSNGIYPGWCVDKRYNIPRNTDVQVQLYSSLKSPVDLQSQRWDMINYILNNKQGLKMDIQNAIWYFVKMDGVGWWTGATPSTMAQAIVNDAIENGDGFIPGSGDAIALICVPETETQITIIEIVVPRTEGLTPGFWKNHIDQWVGYSPDDTFFDVFAVGITIDAGKKSENTNPTLLEALSAKGGVNEEDDVYDALVRHAVASLLNAAHPEVEYSMTKQAIIDAVTDAINNAGAEPLKDTLEEYNNLGGGIDAHGNPI